MQNKETAKLYINKLKTDESATHRNQKQTGNEIKRNDTKFNWLQLQYKYNGTKYERNEKKQPTISFIVYNYIFGGIQVLNMVYVDVSE